MNNLERPVFLREGGLSPQEQAVLWAKQMLERYDNLPKGNARQRIEARNLVVQTAEYLIVNPQVIDTVVNVWKSVETKEEQYPDNQKTESFYDLVKQEVLQDIRGQWRTATLEQLVELGRAYKDSVFMQDVFQHDSLLLTVQQASGLLNVHPNTLRRWGENGKLKVAARLGERRDRRFTLYDVMGLIDKS